MFETNFKKNYMDQCQARRYDTKAEMFVQAFIVATHGMGRAAIDEVEAWMCFEDTEAEICEDRGEDFVLVFLDGSKAVWCNTFRRFFTE